MEVVTKLIRGFDLSYEEACGLFDAFFREEIPKELTGAILLALNYKGIKPEELSGAITVARKNMIRVELSDRVCDTCGTGGDGKKTFNVSTATSLLVRSLGYKVAKHGNKKITGFIGSIDIAERLGLPVADTKESAIDIFEETGFVILFARAFHPAFLKFAGLRQALAIPTVFNILGPLINPANPSYQLIGVYRKDLMDTIASALFLLGDYDRVIVHDLGGFDEVTGSDKVRVVEVRREGVKSWEFEPEKVVGRRLAPPVVDSEKSAIERFVESLRDPDSDSAKTVALNSAFVLYAMGVEDIDRGYELSLRAIREGVAYDTLVSLSKFGVAKNG